MTFHLLRVSPLSLYVQLPSLTPFRFHKTPPFLTSQHLGNSLLCGQDSDQITRSSNSASAIMQQTLTGGGAPRMMQGPQGPSACSPGLVLSPPGPRSPPPAPLLLGLHLLCPHPHAQLPGTFSGSRKQVPTGSCRPSRSPPASVPGNSEDLSLSLS